MSKTWDDFFGNPIISSFLEEAAVEQVDSDDDPIQDGPAEAEPEAPRAPEKKEGEHDIEQLAVDFQQGNITQEDLINMYKAGNLSKDEISQILEGIQNSDEPEDQEELLAQQIDQTNDMFIKFSLYDKIVDLNEKLDYFKENFNDMQSETYTRVLQLGEYLNILSKLIFNIDTTISYQMYGSILLRLTELLDNYNKSQEVEAQQMEK